MRCRRELFNMVEVYISVDVEASGPIPGKYSMLSLGACEVGHSDRQFYTELRPTSEQFVPDAMKVIGRSLSEFARLGRDPAEAMSAFRDWVEQTGDGRQPIFVAFNATFDWSFVNFYFHT